MNIEDQTNLTTIWKPVWPWALPSSQWHPSSSSPSFMEQPHPSTLTPFPVWFWEMDSITVSYRISLLYIWSTWFSALERGLYWAPVITKLMELCLDRALICTVRARTEVNSCSSTEPGSREHYGSCLLFTLYVFFPPIALQFTSLIHQHYP